MIGLAAAAALSSGALAEPVKLRTDGGVVIGASEGGVNVFKGVPYALPPVGELRWRPPQPIRWSGERTATEYALPCPQPTPPDGSANGGGVSGPTKEDCLYLNVWAPKNARNAPVMLWLYGGAGYLGAGSVPTYDGSAFAKSGVILVTINYRLGMLGQFAHPALTRAAGPTEPLANYQLMDAVAALEWVQRNAKALGADTSNVTLFGQSAGAVLVAALLSTPPAKGLFHKAIVQSATPQLGGGRTLAQAEDDGIKFANTLGLPGADASPEQLRALPVDQVISDAARGPGFSNGSYLILDGRFRTTTTGAGLRSGATVDVPLIDGSTKAEFFGPEAYRMVKAAAARNKSPVWQYFFTYVPTARAAELTKGPPHAWELPFVFNTFEGDRRTRSMTISEADRAVAMQMNACWVAFAKARRASRTLNCGGFAWPAYSADTDELAVFDAKPSVTKAAPLIEQNAIDFPARPGLGEPQPQ